MSSRINPKKKWPVIEQEGLKAIVGSSHQVLTINRDILFTTTPSHPSLMLLGGESEHNYVDMPIDKSGKLRLSTYNNYAFHIGNVIESWMLDVHHNNLSTPPVLHLEQTVEILPNLFHTEPNDKLYKFYKKILKKIFVKLYGKG